MSLFSSLQLATNALHAQSIGLQVVGQNIANVNTPGYSRATTVYTPAPTQRVGNLLLGLGVEVDSIKQIVDEHLNSRLRAATADRVGGEVQENAYSQLEGIINELQDNDLSTSLNNFLGAISQVLNQPESVSVRNLAVLQGKTLAGDINRLASRAGEVRDDLNAQISDLEPDVNRLLQRVAELNVKIATTEGGGSVGSDAVGLRDQRNEALQQLSELIDIKTQEQSSGAVNVYAGGDFLIFEGTYRHVEAIHTQEGGLNVAKLQIQETDAPLPASTGKLAGLVDARDNIVAGFMKNLDSFAKTLSYEFNKVFSSGQGLSGYTSLTAENVPSDADAPLDAAGLPNIPVNGAFNIVVHNKQTDLTKTTQIRVDLNGLDGDDLTLNKLVAQLNAVDGVSASLDARGRLVLKSSSPNSEFAFGDDTSGLLASLGINTFFTGSTASDLGVSGVMSADPSKFAASRSGIDGDTQNAVALAGFASRLLDSADGKSISDIYDQLVSGVTQGSAVAKSVATGFRTFETTLQGQQLAISGVNLDEEAVTMMSYQRAFQASAKFISTINDLLELLTQI